MVRGVGIDTVSIKKTRQLIESLNDIYLESVYTKAERKLAERHPDLIEFYAGNFAVKEATFKAVAHLTNAKKFDLRIVETLNDPDGSPQITITEDLKPILDNANVTDLFVSITNEDDYATAIVIACG